ncbi:MAG: hypothetical protein BWZ10_00761 [candidate division BRC1 bacterium ADurb.BinA364]|nr:MAG: hypothetical protein BWZ10_00761 [candidate division BRC1 bacterium ADurb.BinA364]
MIIKPVLILFGIGIVAFYFRYMKSAVLDRLLVLLCFAAMAAFVLDPSLTDAIAQWMGVESGRYLLLYFSILFFIFLFLLVFVRMRNMERSMTLITRAIAIHDARAPQGAAAQAPQNAQDDSGAAAP